MTLITDRFRARLTANAEDFDGIVASMLAVMEEQEQRIESMRGALRRCAEVMRRSDLEEFEPEISPVTSVEWFSAIEMAERMATANDSHEPRRHRT